MMIICRCIDLLVDIQIRIDFTVSYDKFYQVPIYHLRLFINDKLDFDIEKVWNILRSNDNQRLEKVDLLIVDHALLQSPWLQIHPCETLNTLDIFTKGQNINQETETGKESKSTLQYLICWFNLYALPTTFPQFSLRPNSAAAVAVVDAADATTTTTTTTQ
ncbi:hypothetical protein KGF56_003252 [Candida oxycetoniae]|uniref:Ubiquitin-like-conjugating enzyme ATG10 n=1 Tax=Candida oxycetoniae TaxID=497107 RepID=A0AAI9SWE8_9ASCO|nr:uncharacterized protein KGF56_003252 [Candida oxycetoniae]KAI3403985.2 hypothetical protein KGF56_003252 [Candida oxycetoniae]